LVGLSRSLGRVRVVVARDGACVWECEVRVGVGWSAAPRARGPAKAPIPFFFPHMDRLSPPFSDEQTPGIIFHQSAGFAGRPPPFPDPSPPPPPSAYGHAEIARIPPPPSSAPRQPSKSSKIVIKRGLPSARRTPPPPRGAAAPSFLLSSRVQSAPPGGEKNLITAIFLCHPPPGVCSLRRMKRRLPLFFSSRRGGPNTRARPRPGAPGGRERSEPRGLGAAPRPRRAPPRTATGRGSREGALKLGGRATARGRQSELAAEIGAPTGGRVYVYLATGCCAGGSLRWG
jgi:hypothetical protein